MSRDDGETARPLVTAAEMYPALEEMVLAAEAEVLLSFRIFQPTTRLRSQAARGLGLADWGALVAHLTGRGLRVRILLADFDPVFATELHEGAWEAARGFADAVGDGADFRLQLHLHGARVGPVWKTLLRPKVAKRLSELRETPRSADTPALRAALGGSWDLYPVSLHQKFALADGKHAIVGGIDVDERRYDSPDHDRPSDETWHDVSLEVTGPVVADLRAHFADGWRTAREDGATDFGDGTGGLDARPPPRTPPREAPLSLLRTVSTPAPGALRFGPRPAIREHETAHLDLFARAERLVYLETQFFRHLPLARALAEAAARAPDLQLILLMPTEPERIIFGGDRGIDARHAQALQIRCLDLVRRAFGDRLAVVSPAKPEPLEEEVPAGLHGAGIVYVHAKVTVVDDRAAIVGSANLNGRSMRWDTEASILWRDPDGAQALRLRLARKWMGDEAPLADLGRAAAWMDRARANATRPPERRQGFLLPYPEARNRRFAFRLPVLPDDMF